MALETVIASLESSKPIKELQYTLEPSAKELVSRRSVRYHPQGSNIYRSRNGTKVIKIVLSGHELLDPTSVRLNFALKNESATLRLLNQGGVWTFFRRLKVSAKGQVLEDIDFYGKVHQLLHNMLPKDVKKNEIDEGTGFELNLSKWLRDKDYRIVETPTGGSVRAGQSRYVSFKPLCGILNQSKLLPLDLCPLEFEFELVDDATAPLVQTVPLGSTSGTAHTHDASSLSVDGDLSTEWSIENPSILCDVLQLTADERSKFTRHLMSGGTLPIAYSTFVTVLQNLSSGTQGSQQGLINCTRAVSRLQSAFIYFSRSTDSNGNQIIYDGKKTLSNDNTKENKLYSNDLNEFYSPHTYNNGQQFDPDNELHCQLTIGNRKFPDTEIQSTSEAFYHLRKTMGSHSSSVHSCGIDIDEFMNDKFVIALDTEKSTSAYGSGENLKNGSLISFKYKFLTNVADRWAKYAYITLHCNNILEIYSTGVTVLD